MRLATGAPIEHPTLHAHSHAVHRPGAARAALTVAAVHRETSHFVRPRRVAVTQLCAHQRCRSVHDADRIGLGQLADRGERADSRGPQGLAAIHVADAEHHSLIEQHFAQPSRGILVRQEKVDDEAEVGIGLCEVRSETSTSRVAPFVGSPVRLDVVRVEAHGDPVLVLDRHVHLFVRATPLLSLAVDVPRPGSAQVGVQDHPVVPLDLEMLAVRFDVFDGAARLWHRADESRRVEPGHRLATERRPQGAGSSMNGDFLRHLEAHSTRHAIA